MKFLVVLLLVIFPSTVLAQPLVSLPPGEDNITSLKKGAPAPYDGQLFDTNTSIRWGNWMQQYQLRLKIDVAAQKDIDDAKLTFMEEIRKIEREQYSRVTVDYQKKVRLLEEKLAAPTPWYRTQTFAFVMGAVCTTGVFALSVWAVDATKK
jgi:hypothetical protein